MITTTVTVVVLLSLLRLPDPLVRKEYRVQPDLKDPLVQVQLVQWVRLDRLATLDQLVPDLLVLKAFKV